MRYWAGGAEAGQTSAALCPLAAWGGLRPFCAGLRTSIYITAGDRGGMEQEVPQPGREGAAEASSAGDSGGQLSVSENPPPPAPRGHASQVLPSRAAGCWTNGAPPTATWVSMMSHQPCGPFVCRQARTRPPAALPGPSCRVACSEVGQLSRPPAPGPQSLAPGPRPPVPSPRPPALFPFSQAFSLTPSLQLSPTVCLSPAEPAQPSGQEVP